MQEHGQLMHHVNFEFNLQWPQQLVAPNQVYKLIISIGKYCKE